MAILTISIPRKENNLTIKIQTYKFHDNQSNLASTEQ